MTLWISILTTGLILQVIWGVAAYRAMLRREEAALNTAEHWKSEAAELREGWKEADDIITKLREEETQLRDELTIETKEHDVTKHKLELEVRGHEIAEAARQSAVLHLDHWRAMAESHTQVIASLKELHKLTLDGLLQLRREGFSPPAQAESMEPVRSVVVTKEVLDALEKVPLKRTSRAYKDLYDAALRRLQQGADPKEVAQWITEGKKRRMVAAAEAAVGEE